MTEAIQTLDGIAEGDELVATDDGIEVHQEVEGHIGTIDVDDFTEFADELDAVMNGDAEEMNAPTWSEVGVGQTILGDLGFYAAENEDADSSEHEAAIFDPNDIIGFADDEEL